MRHANNESAATIFNSGIYRYLEAGNEALAPFETKTLHSIELLPNKLTEIMRPV